jgi:branched-chain amino acid transport system substrate-binding protein
MLFVRKGFVVAAMAALSAFAPSAVQSAETVKVGFIAAFSGPSASLGDTMDKAVKLYLKEHEKDLGDIKLEIIRRDDTGINPDLAKRLAQELITRDKVDLLTGFIYTPNLNAVAPLVSESKTPVIIMNAATSSSIRLSPYFARVSMTVWQSAFPMGQWAAKQGIKNVFTAVTDYAPGHDAEAAFIKGFTDAGGKIAGSVRMPARNADYTPFLQRIKDEKPEALFAFTPGGKEAAAFVKAYSDLGLAKSGIRMIAEQSVVTDDELENMGDVPPGIVTIGHYSAVGDRPANKAFVAAWKRDYGPDAVPNIFSVAAWDGMAAIFDVIKAQKGKIDADKTMELLKGWKNDQSPRGPIMINPETRDIIQNEYIRKLERVNGKLANVEIETIPMVKDPWPAFNPAK